MSVFIVSYDLKSPGKDYSNLYDAIRRYTSCRILDSVWLVDSSESAAQIRDYLKGYIDSNDELLVARLRQAWATTFSDSATEWLKAPSRTWD